MKLKQMSQEEIELLSHTDLTYLLLVENKKPMSTADIFKKISKLLGYTEEEYATKIGDFYTSLTIDKRFVLLENGNWDIRDRHSVEIVVDEEEEEVVDDVVEEEETAIESDEEDEEDIDAIDEDENLDTDDSLDDLTIIDEEEEEEA